VRTVFLWPKAPTDCKRGHYVCSHLLNSRRKATEVCHVLLDVFVCNVFGVRVLESFVACVPALLFLSLCARVYLLFERHLRLRCGGYVLVRLLPHCALADSALAAHSPTAALTQGNRARNIRILTGDPFGVPMRRATLLHGLTISLLLTVGQTRSLGGRAVGLQ
jgi:hypothetical protein